MAFDFYLDFVFLIEVVAIFNKPVYDVNQHLVTDRKVIALKYLKGWFILDIIALMPISYIKMKSEFLPRTKDDIMNTITGNFNSVPRFYKLMLGLKFVRVRRVKEYLQFILKKSALRIQAQAIIITFCTLAFFLNLIGCIWRGLADGNLKTNASWLRG